MAPAPLVRLAVVPVKEPLKEPHGNVPLTLAPANSVVAVLRTYVPMPGASVVVLARHITPKVGSLILYEPPMKSLRMSVCFLISRPNTIDDR